MTQIKVDNIADAAGTGAPDFEDGLTVAGSAISTLNTAEYYSGETEPSSPKNGAIWKDTANDKLMIYVAGEFKEIELGASAGGSWTVDLSNVTYDSVSLNIGGQDTSGQGIHVSPDGTKMYIAGNSSDSVLQYSFSTAFDLSTASYDNVSFSVGSQDSVPMDVAFNLDGTKMYVVGNSSDTVYQYSLSTGFDLSTASYDNVSFNVSSQDSTPRSIFFNSDGTKMYIASSGVSDSIHQYSLPTAFSLGTASYDSVSFSTVGQDSTPSSSFFNTDGTKMYVLGGVNDSVYQYSLSTSFDLSTASYDNISVSVASQGVGSSDIAFSNDGTKMYMVCNATESVYQYSTGL